jgi:prolyl 4-hydroxylase
VEAPTLPAVPEVSIMRVSVRPAVFVLRNFASVAETEALRSVAAGRYTSSGTKGTSVTRMDHEPFLPVRTSSSLFLSLEDMGNGAVAKISRRIEETLLQVVRESNKQEQAQLHVLDVNPLHAEVFQMARYGPGEYYAAHSDYAKDDPAYDRAATFLLYLASSEDGGETVFPYLSGDPGGANSYSWNRQTDFRKFACGVANTSRPACALPYCCCEDVLSVKPFAGDALLFFPMKADGSKEEMAVHAACPPLSAGGEAGYKEVVQQWFHKTHPAPETALHPQPSRKAGSRRRANRSRRKAAGDG